MKRTKGRVFFLVQGAVIAALYIVLTYAQELLLPGTTSMAVQFRISEIQKPCNGACVGLYVCSEKRKV